MQTLDTIGNVLSIVGIVIALFALLSEGRTRDVQIGGKVWGWVRHRAVVMWARIRKRPPQRVEIGPAIDTIGLTDSFEVRHTRQVDPAAPVAEQLAALDHNLREGIEHLERRQDGSAERLSERIENVRHAVRDTHARVVENEREEKEIATASLRREMWGLLLAGVGTALSAVASLFGQA